MYSWTLITSSFSQKDVGHLLFNGFSYYFTVPSILFALGNTGFLALYLGAGLVASVSSIWWHTAVQKQSKFSSLGASGPSRLTPRLLDD
jgi:rhomboid-like protein